MIGGAGSVVVVGSGSVDLVASFTVDSVPEDVDVVESPASMAVVHAVNATSRAAPNRFMFVNLSVGGYCRAKERDRTA